MRRRSTFTGAAALTCWMVGACFELPPPLATAGDGDCRDAPEACSFGCAEDGRCVVPVGLTAGGEHGCAWDDAGALYCWGTVDRAALGLGERDTGVATARRVPYLPPVAAASAGRAHTCALTRAGAVWCWGANTSSQIALTPAVVADPVPVIGLEHVSALSVGLRNTSCAVRTDGQIACWGTRLDGGQPDGDARPPERTPLVVYGFEPEGAAAVAVGAWSACGVVATTGAVRCWGAGDVGQLGTGWVGDAPNAAVPAGALTAPVAQLAVGGRHACALLAGGDEVLCWGDNDRGQTGAGLDKPVALVPVALGERLATSVTSVVAGDAFTCALDQAGDVWCWGDNGRRQLGRGDLDATATPSRVPGVTGAVALAAGPAHACALDARGAVWCWGANDGGQLGAGVAGGDVAAPTRVRYEPPPGCEVAGVRLSPGDPHPNVACTLCDPRGERFSPCPLGCRADGRCAVAVAVDASHGWGCAVTDAEGALWCWGSGYLGVVGGDGGASADELPRRRQDLPPVAQISLGQLHACARAVDGGVWCWGNNRNGQTGAAERLEEMAPTAVALPGPASWVTAGGNEQSCAVVGGAVWCWGRPLDGVSWSPQLEDLPNLHVPRQVAGLEGFDAAEVHVTAGAACALSGQRDAIRCWGDGRKLELARPAEAGDATAAIPIAGLPAGPYDALTASERGFCVATAASEALVCWGRSSNGALGVGTDCSIRSTLPVDVRDHFTGELSAVGAGDRLLCGAVGADRALACLGSNGDATLTVDPKSPDCSVVALVRPHVVDVVEVAPFNDMSCLRQASGFVRCWGRHVGDGSGGWAYRVPPAVGFHPVGWIY